MRKISLTQDKFALIDDEDYDWLNQWKWCAGKPGKSNTFYATRYGNIFMHRVILGLQKGDKRQTDHINHNGLDNRRCNLRIVTCQQNQQNLRNIKGCCWHKQAGKWVAYINVNKKRIYLGLFDSEQEAHQTYLDAKKKYHCF